MRVLCSMTKCINWVCGVHTPRTHIAGGYDGDEIFNSMRVYDARASGDKWRACAPMIDRRAYVSAVAFEYVNALAR